MRPSRTLIKPLSTSTPPLREGLRPTRGFTARQRLLPQVKLMGQCFIDGQTELLISRLPVISQANLRQCRQLFSQGDGGMQDLSVFHHTIGQPHGQGFISAHRPTGQDEILLT